MCGVLCGSVLVGVVDYVWVTTPTQHGFGYEVGVLGNHGAPLTTPPPPKAKISISGIISTFKVIYP